MRIDEKLGEVKRAIRMVQDLVVLSFRRDVRAVRTFSDGEERARQAALSWVTDTIGRPDPRLGRSGAVCPCTPPALRGGAVTIAVYPEETEVSADVLRRVVLREGLAHRRQVNRSVSQWELQTHLVVFPGGGSGDANVFERAWEGCLEPLNERETMVAVAYPGCQRPALSSPHVFPFDAPVTLFVIRPMTLRDVVFISNRGGMRSYRTLFGSRYADGAIARGSALATTYQQKLSQHGLDSSSAGHRSA